MFVDYDQRPILKSLLVLDHTTIEKAKDDLFQLIML